MKEDQEFKVLKAAKQIEDNIEKDINLEFLAVGFGAFAAHVLGESINLKVFETANRFHFYHTLASFACLACYSKMEEKFFLFASSFFYWVGQCLFSRL